MKNQAVLLATWRDGLFLMGSDEIRHELPNRPVKWIAPYGSAGVLVIVGPNLLLARSPDGEYKTLATSTLALSCCMAVGPVVYVGTEDARMLRWNNATGELEPIKAFDSVPGRDSWFSGSAVVDGKLVGPPLGIRSLSANAAGSVLFANVHVGGIPRSADGGASWLPTIAIESDVHEVCSHPTDPQTVVAAADVGLCISRDAGKTWTIEAKGLHTPHCYAVAISGEDVLVSASEHPFFAPGTIYRRPLRPDGRMEAVAGGLPDRIQGGVDTHCIATNGSFVALADRGGNLYRSCDFGRTWALAGTGLPGPSSLLHS